MTVLDERRPTPEAPPADPATLKAAATLAAASLVTLAAGGPIRGGRLRVITPVDVVRPDGDDGDDNPNHENRTFHDAPYSDLMATLARISVRES